MTAEEIVKKEVARQAEFGMEPSWGDFVIAGMEAQPKLDRGKIVQILKDNIQASSFDSRDTHIYGIYESADKIIALELR